MNGREAMFCCRDSGKRRGNVRKKSALSGKGKRSEDGNLRLSVTESNDTSVVDLSLDESSVLLEDGEKV